MSTEFNPRFVRRYADLRTIMVEAAAQYVRDVRERSFPSIEESY
jgi:3-methyl-2-oxobutanoate hydroxymethyltransferase